MSIGLKIIGKHPIQTHMWDVHRDMQRAVERVKVGLSNLSSFFFHLNFILLLHLN